MDIQKIIKANNPIKNKSVVLLNDGGFMWVEEEYNQEKLNGLKSNFPNAKYCEVEQFYGFSSMPRDLISENDLILTPACYEWMVSINHPFYLDRVIKHFQTENIDLERFLLSCGINKADITEEKVRNLLKNKLVWEKLKDKYPSVVQP